MHHRYAVRYDGVCEKCSFAKLSTSSRTRDFLTLVSAKNFGEKYVYGGMLGKNLCKWFLPLLLARSESVYENICNMAYSPDALR